MISSDDDGGYDNEVCFNNSDDYDDNYETDLTKLLATI